MPDLILSPQVFAILTGLIAERVGLSYTQSEKPIFDAKASARAIEAGFDSMLDYYYFLRYDDPEQREFQRLVEALVVHETFFFRELGPLEVAVAQFVAPRVAEGGTARVWCAACATGEEPVTLAMLLEESALSGRVQLVASDVSESALRRARSGKFSPRALRQGREHPLASRYLERSAAELTASPALLAGIDFRRINLTDNEAVQKLGSFDLIVCRNVLIYFGDQHARQVVDQLTELLAPGGAILVGVSESLMRFGTKLVCEERGGVFFYRRQSPA
ncbi:MAG: chemotaxis protein CheR [Myxococcaceae bacterium]|nr:chemotaxis protein CheR [Myxococcaceae bacterium]